MDDVVAILRATLRALDNSNEDLIKSSLVVRALKSEIRRAIAEVESAKALKKSAHPASEGKKPARKKPQQAHVPQEDSANPRSRRRAGAR